MESTFTAFAMSAQGRVTSLVTGRRFLHFVSFVSDDLMMSSEDLFARLVCALVTNQVGSRLWRSAARKCAQHFQVDECSQQ